MFSFYTMESLISRSASEIFVQSKSKLMRQSNPYSVSSSKSLSVRSNSKSNTQKRPKYQNWGMRIDSNEALQEQMHQLKKENLALSKKNKMIKTEKRRMAKQLSKNNRKLANILNSFCNEHKSKDANCKTKLTDTQLFNLLNAANDDNASLRCKLEKKSKKLLETERIIKDLENDRTSKYQQIRQELKESKDESQRLLKEIKESAKIKKRSQSQIKRLSNKLFEIELALKDRIESLQKYEKICNQNDKFLNLLCTKSEHNTFFQSMRKWFGEIQTAHNDDDLQQIAQTAEECISKMFGTATHQNGSCQHESDLQVIPCKSSEKMNQDITQNLLMHREISILSIRFASRFFIKCIIVISIHLFDQSIVQLRQ